MKARRIVNRDRSEYRGVARKAHDFGVKFRPKSHGDARKAASKKAARDRRTWED